MLTTDELLNVYPRDVFQQVTWLNPVIGDDGEYIQDKVDQLSPLVPFIPSTEPYFQIPQLAGSNNSLFTSDGTSFTEVDLYFSNQETQMKSIATLLKVSSSSLGTNIAQQKLALLEEALRQTMRRFLSVAMIYGAYGNGYQYYGAWDQSIAFTGLQVATTNGDGYASQLSTTLTLDILDDFLHTFLGSNNGRVDYIVMNSDLRKAYLQFWRTAGQLPEYIVDRLSGQRCLAHDGIPILTDDYILTYDPSSDPNTNPENPEPGVPPGTTDLRTSLYAVNCGAEHNGIFGLFPESFGDSPLKIEHSRSSETDNSIYMRGMIETALTYPTKRSVGRLHDIYLS